MEYLFLYKHDNGDIRAVQLSTANHLEASLSYFRSCNSGHRYICLEKYIPSGFVWISDLLLTEEIWDSASPV